MEPIGLGVGVVGLAGLFTVCLDVIDRVKAYRSFAFDSDVIQVQLDAHRLRLKRWGLQVGLASDYGDLTRGHHRCLDDPPTRKSAEDILRILHQVFEGADQPRNLLDKAAGSRRQKLSWALGGKKDRAGQVALLGRLVDQLHLLVPEDDRVGPQHQDSLSDDHWFGTLRQALDEWEAEKRRAVHRWILGDRPLNKSRYEDACKKRLPESCNWILERPDFKRWASSDQSADDPWVLWVHGRPGFGKTILSSRVVEHLLEDPRATVAHVFFSADHSTRDDPWAILRSWVSQTAEMRSEAYDIIARAWAADRGQTASRTASLKLLREILGAVPNCVLVVDGLDECSSTAEYGTTPVSRFLDDLLSLATAGSRLLIVSRDDYDIRQALTKDSSGTVVSIYEITPEDVHDDVVAFSRSLIDRKLSNKDEELRQSLARSMSERCEGQFLWMKLQESSLKSWKNSRQLQAALEVTPKGIEKIYERSWQKITSGDQFDRAVSLLRWATFSMRPLTVGEIMEAALIEEDLEDLPRDEMPDTIDKDFVNSEVIQVCASLLELAISNTETPLAEHIVQLPHFTAKQFLLGCLPVMDLGVNDKLRASNEQKQHTTLARLCLRYIQLRQTWTNSQEATAFKLYTGVY